MSSTRTAEGTRSSVSFDNLVRVLCAWSCHVSPPLNTNATRTIARRYQNLPNFLHHRPGCGGRHDLQNGHDRVVRSAKSAGIEEGTATDEDNDAKKRHDELSKSTT